MSSKSARWYKTLRYILQRYRQSNCSVQASALTLDTLLSLVPLLATSIALFAAIPSLQHLVAQAEQKLLASFIYDTGHDVAAYLQQATQQAATVSIIGALILLATSIKMLYTLNRAFESMLIARVRQKTRSEIALSCLAWIFAPLLAGLGIACSSFIMSLPFLTQHSGHLNLLRPVLMLLSLFLNTLAFSFLYIVSPLFIVPLRNVIYGASVAAVLFEMSKWLFGLYIVHFPSYQALYGALAAIPLFLIWLNISWQIALFGAVMAQALIYTERYRSAVKLDGFTHAILWLGHLWQAHKNEKGLSIDGLISREQVSYAVEPEQMIERLRELNLIDVTAEGQYKLAMNIDTLSLYNCFQLLPWKLPTATNLQALDFSWKEKIIPIVEALAESQQLQLSTELVSIYGPP